ncbi:MAG: DUF4082 domain-containing protein [Acidimicrobiales bacterium]
MGIVVVFISLALVGASNAALPPAGAAPVNLFGAALPANPVQNDGKSVELGVKVRPSVDGWISGVRYYAGQQTTGTKVATLWSNKGTMLAQATFSNPLGTGWQEVTFSSPLAVKAATVYVVSYFTPNGYYPSDNGFFNTQFVNGPLTAVNSVYRYATVSRFPSTNYNNTNYFVDALFITAAAAPATTTTIAPATTTTLPAGTTTTTRPTATTTSAPPATTTTSTIPPVTTTTTIPPATTTTTTAPPPPPGEGFAVGSGLNAMAFPEKPGLTVAESSLTPYTGPRQFNSGTHSFSNCLVTGSRLYLPEGSTANVSFKNCKFRISDTQMVLGQGGRLNIEHSLFDGALTGDEPALVMEGGGVVRFSEFVNDTDHIRLGSNGTAEWNWIHQPMTRTSSGAAHADGIEVYYAARENGAPATGPHVFVRNNYIAIEGAEGANSSVNITNDFGTVDGVRVEGNTFMNGGGYSLFIRGDGYCGCGGNNRNIEVVNNRWFGVDPSTVPDGGGGWWGGYYGTHSYQPGVGITQWSGNVLNRNGAPTTISVESAQP